ncbi:hypothetical protein CHISP_2970 [Chitinispirillum alkaliphilum]|nr:hypothetical protein CHISP_2970 [Chitinispirillum alkaliphilum]
MLPNELISRSPLRILEKSTHGGVGKGNIGVISARKGVGKTACLVHIATDQLFQDKHIIHVSFAADTSHIMTWYEEVYQEIARLYKLEDDNIHDKLTKNRVIMNFKQDSASVPKVLKGIRAMVKDAQFGADIVIVDGYDFEKSTPEEFSIFKEMAEEMNIEIWFSATVHRDDTNIDEHGVAKSISRFKDNLAIMIQLEPRENYIHLHLIKDHDVYPAADNLHLKLDPHSLLIMNES